MVEVCIVDDHVDLYNVRTESSDVLSTTLV